MEQKTISIDSETATKLKRISEASHISQTAILKEFLEACCTVLETIETERISFDSIPNAERHCVETILFPMLVGVLPACSNRTKDSTVDKRISKKLRRELLKKVKI